MKDLTEHVMVNAVMSGLCLSCIFLVVQVLPRMKHECYQDGMLLIDVAGQGFSNHTSAAVQGLQTSVMAAAATVTSDFHRSYLDCCTAVFLRVEIRMSQTAIHTLRHSQDVCNGKLAWRPHCRQ